ncbi:hypothetical protein DFQ27_002233 [Actinomortierella ambigua]|uniref:Uncharacterized protein n=1 Tax=Actinomortierella ambigua TaxID=1343610 RepID=A0A9P6Q906_9FUNG|nr:hypothetical protein DFQ27_002233 [Actinomortierella ambigua]
MVLNGSAARQGQIVDIGDGLIMRWSTSADAENVSKLMSDCFRFLPSGRQLPDDQIPGENEVLANAARRLLKGTNACMSSTDYALVENTQAGPSQNPIVAAVSLHEIPGYYGSVRLTYGKPELIACDPQFRSRGLIRKLMMEMIHPESDRRGHVLQMIFGIGYFYREMPDISWIPKLGEGEKEQYTLRQATLDDIPFLVRLSTNENLYVDAEMGSAYDEKYWRWLVHDVYQNPVGRYDGHRITTIIRDETSGRDIGFNQTAFVYSFLWFKFALEKGEPLHKILHPVMRQMLAIGNKQCMTYREQELAMKAAKGESTDDVRKPQLSSMRLALGPKHPAMTLVQSKLAPEEVLPVIPLYTRVFDYSAFILKVAPTLEARLAQSVFAGATAKLQLNFFKKLEGMSASGLEVVFEKGKIVSASPWKKPSPEAKVEEVRKRKAAGLPALTIYAGEFHPLTFTSLLTGYRSFMDLAWSNADTNVDNEDSRYFLEALFPKVSHDFDLFIW